MSMPSFNKVKTTAREAIASVDESLGITETKQPPEPIYDDTGVDTPDRITGAHKLSQLVDDDFPFDESQLAAVEGMAASQYACMTGAAGTGKTTSTKKLVDRLMQTTQVGVVDMSKYWSSDLEERLGEYDDGDDYEHTDDMLPTVAMCAYTGRASQQIKSNFPKDWHGNIMTIHRMLGFVPESYEEWDSEWIDEETGLAGAFRNKIRFSPTYTAAVKMPWDIILIDEAGMLGLDLWKQLLAAVKPGCRIYMIGDINQLPPVHGLSIFGFAMAKWPAFELTKVHRQQGKNNPIVDNAWRVIHGERPVSEGNFQMVQLPGDAIQASRKVRGIAKELSKRGIYDPIRDTIITPINGDKAGAGAGLGQLPLNTQLALMFNPESEHPRYVLDGGREKKQFAVGDKVMATKNDWAAGITNGMTGIITDIANNAGYTGDRDRYGILSEVNERFANEEDNFEQEFMTVEGLENTLIAQDEGRKASKEKRERGPSSHIVTVKFGKGDAAFELPFSSLSEVGSLQTAYAATCHKMQGGEAPTIIIILHESHRRMLYREWFYTAITRASGKCIVLFTDLALRVSLNKQKIKGASLREKVLSFLETMNPKGSVDDADEWLPIADNQALTILEREETPDEVTARRLMSEADRKGGLGQMIAAQRQKKEQVEPPKDDSQEVHIHVTQKITVNVSKSRRAEKETQPPDKDGGTIRGGDTDRDRTHGLLGLRRMAIGGPVTSLPKPVETVSQVGAARMYVKLQNAQAVHRLLTHRPTPKKKTLNDLFAKRKDS